MHAGSESGYSLVELLIVAFILAIVAAVALPDMQGGDEQEFNLAVQEIVAAIRFSRSEAIRTGLPHGVRIEPATKRIQVFSLNMNTVPPTSIYDVYHPVTKQLYDIDLGDHPFAAAPDIKPKEKFDDKCNMLGKVYFDKAGTPRCTDPSNVLLKSYELALQEDGYLTTIVIDGITGRVTAQ